MTWFWGTGLKKQTNPKVQYISRMEWNDMQQYQNK